MPVSNLLHNIPPEVYRAYFGRQFDRGDGVEIVAEDPNWETGNVRRLSELCVRTMARFFMRKPNAVNRLINFLILG